VGAAGGTVGVVQAVSTPTSSTEHSRLEDSRSRLHGWQRITENKFMWLLLLEAGIAFLLLAFIVWWTMFSGRKPDVPAAPPDSVEHPHDEP
jgi:hypothetical protein